MAQRARARPTPGRCDRRARPRRGTTRRSRRRRRALRAVARPGLTAAGDREARARVRSLARRARAPRRCAQLAPPRDAVGRRDRRRGARRARRDRGGRCTDADHAAAELDTAISSFVTISEARRMSTRIGCSPAPPSSRSRAHRCSIGAAMPREPVPTGNARTDSPRSTHRRSHGPPLTDDARARAADPIGERRWIDAVLATRPPRRPSARPSLISRADVRRKEATPPISRPRSRISTRPLALLEEETSDPVARRRALRARGRAAREERRCAGSRARPSPRSRRSRSARATGSRWRPPPPPLWLAADEPACRPAHGARAHAQLGAPTSPRHFAVGVLVDARRGPVAPARLARRDPRVSRPTR